MFRGTLNPDPRNSPSLRSATTAFLLIGPRPSYVGSFNRRVSHGSEAITGSLRGSIAALSGTKVESLGFRGL